MDITNPKILKAKGMLFLVLGLLSGACVLILLPGCASSPLPPRLTDSQDARLKELPLPYSVGVARYRHPAYSEALNSALASSGAFRRVAPLDEFHGKPDFIATVEETVHGTALIPVATFVTGGVVPTVTEEWHGFRFALAPGSHPDRKTLVDAAYSGTTTLGWAAAAMNASGNYTAGDPHESERFRKMLAYRTLSALRP